MKTLMLALVLAVVAGTISCKKEKDAGPIPGKPLPTSDYRSKYVGTFVFTVYDTFYVHRSNGVSGQSDTTYTYVADITYLMQDSLITYNAPVANKILPALKINNMFWSVDMNGRLAHDGSPTYYNEGGFITPDSINHYFRSSATNYHTVTVTTAHRQ